MMNKSIEPKVSIIIPVYNGADYLREAIDSALSQEYSNFEVLVINDGSTDGGKTEGIALSYGDKIRYIYKENGGVSSALNCGIDNMTGEYFSWLSHDDKYTPYKLKNLVTLIQKNATDRLVAMSGIYHIDKDSKHIKEVKHYFENNKVYTGLEVILYMVKHKTLNGCAMLIPKSVFDECGYFNEELRYNQDSLMWYQIFVNGYNMIVDMENNDVMYRLHLNQASKTRRDLLLHDSYEMTKIIAPKLVKLGNSSRDVLRGYAGRYAIHDCRDAVNECIVLGKEEKVLNSIDVLKLKGTLLYGKARNVAKRIYIKVRLR